MNAPFEAVFPSGAHQGKSTFSPAVRVGDFLYISGMTAVDENRKIVGEGDIAAQARYIYHRISKVLETAGADISQIVETVDYVTTFENYDLTAEVRREVFEGGPYPVATGVQVAGLIRPGALIEISAVAYLGKS